MSKMSKINLYQLFVLTLYASCLVGNALGQFTSNDLSSCSSSCKATFQAQEQDSCIRGCRIISVLGTIHGPVLSQNQLRDSCFGACDEAYTTSTASSCAFGCQSQIPSVESSKDNEFEITVLVDEGCIFSMTKRFSEYSSRIINCMLDQLHHQISVGWKAIISYAVYEDRNGEIIIQESPDIEIPQVAEYQPLYSKTNLAMMGDNGISDLQLYRVTSLNNEKQGGLFGLGHGGLSPLQNSKSIVIRYSCDWLSCLSARTNLSKNTILFLSFILVVVTIYMLLSTCVAVVSDNKFTTDVPKLSIYGDLEHLPLYKEKFSESICEKKLSISSNSSIPSEILNI